ncbi:MAG: PD-(D/E)XK nuclease domain-containing protein [Treponema sp.]|nr:PD-(D/E)XK nuclease domain-containing protein [Treponema sp.]
MTESQKRPVRFFNTTGPCNPWDHYMLPPNERLVGAQLDRYIRDKLYWVLHAPRQTGKTTFLQSWAREINASNAAVACYVTIERCQRLPEPERCMPELCNAIQEHARWSGFVVPQYRTTAPNSMVSEILADFAARVLPKPLVILFDETDALEGDSMISFLRQMRGGFMERGAGKFPVSIALVGMRDLKDYITAAKGGIPPSPLSPFNVKSDSVFLRDFKKDDISELFKQRTVETGQQITGGALEYVWDQTRGQPWIINSLFKRATMRVINEDNYETITIDHIKAAKDQMVTARETHLDSLGIRLQDRKVRRIIELILTGGFDPEMGRTNPDVEYVIDLGLIKWNTQTGFTISNPIYEEILTRYLNSGYHDNLPPPSTWQWQKPDGSLDLDSLLKEFQSFWRQNSEIWEQKSDYTEAFPHLLLMAFLQRILNGGGAISREAAAGRGRMDLLLEYKGSKYIIEIKLIHSNENPDTVKAEGLKQIKMYRDKIDTAAPAYLMIFDRRASAAKSPWDERLFWYTADRITVIGG